MRGKKRKTLGPSVEPEDFAGRLAEFAAWLHRRNYAESTIERMSQAITDFGLYCSALELKRPALVTRPLLERYAQHLFRYRKANGEPLSIHGQKNALSALHVFFRFLVRQNYLLYNPASDMERPRVGQRIPRGVLTNEEVRRVIGQADVGTRPGVRDRAMLETLYSTGLRRFELLKLELSDLDLKHGTLLVREGKGKRDRMVPVGEQALDWNDLYLTNVRPHWAGPGERLLYISAQGGRMTTNGLGNRVREYLLSAGIEREGACHLFRHAMATHMLEQGADTRIIQEILGHTSLESTQVYTQVSIKHLKEVHAETHPSARRGAPEVLGELRGRSPKRGDAVDLGEEETADALEAVSAAPSVERPPSF